MSSDVEKKLINYIIGFTLSLPIILIYLYIFITSMDIALDRINYIEIMANPFQGREEPLIHYYSYISGKIIESSVVKLVFLQFLAILLLLATLIKTFKVYNLGNFVKLLTSLLIFFSVFSNMLGVQLRIGYATILFLFIAFYLNKKPNIRNSAYFLVPCLMHMGVILPVILYYLFHYLKINNRRRYIFFVLFFIISSTFLVKFLPYFLQIIGINAYYFDYLDSDQEFGRKYPFSVIFYLFICFLTFFYSKHKDVNYWYGLSGICLIYMGIFLDLYLAFKMLIAVTSFFYIYIISSIPSKLLNSYFLIVVLILIFPISFLMFMQQVGLL